VNETRPTIAAVAAAAILAAVILAPGPAAAHDKMGALLNGISDFRRNHEFADVLKQARKFLKIGAFNDQDPANLVPIGPDGWPATDFRVLAMAAQQDVRNLAGAYAIVFNGQADVATGGGGAGSVSGKTFDPGTNTTRATLDFPAGGENLILDFTNTGGAVKNLRIIRPGLDADNPPLLNAPWKDHAKRFPVLRFMDWTRTNGNRHVAWEDRTTPEKLRTEAYIARWETVIDAANWLNRDPWINIPVQANDEYVRNLAILLRERLNANLNVYVEYGNELWNFSIRDVDLDEINGGTAFNGATVNADLAAASPAGSPLRFDGEGDKFTLGFRRVALRLKEISDIFKETWGAAAINTRVRPVLAGQMANSFVVSEGLRLLDEGLGVAPASVIYAISGAPYIFPSAIPDGEADEVPGLTKDQILDGLAAGVANAPNENAYQYLSHAAMAAWYGLKVVAYEFGFDNFGPNNVAAKREANLDPRIRQICRDLLNQWHGFGFEHVLWFSAGADSYNTPFGMWPLVEDMADQATPKNQCMDDILAAALPAVTVGTPVLGTAIAGGNFRGSTNTTGSLSGLAGPFGFPGYVEFLLRADDAGTYNVVFNGSAPAGESFRLKLNNATVAANVTLPAATGNSSSIAVTLRKGLNAMRIERAVGASFGIVSFTFTQTGDATPDAFSFASRTNVAAGSTVVSDPATIGGLTMSAAVTVAGGEYSVGCTGTFTSSAGTIADGQTVCVRHTAAASVNTATTTVLTIGGVSGSFTSTTQGAQTQTFALTVSKSGTGTVSSSPAGIDCGATCTASYSGGASVVLTASAGSGFVFTGWSGACTGTASTCQVTMLGARSVTATFVAASAVPRLVNIATRGRVQTGDNVMIAGFIIGGSTPKKVLITARGPSLASLGVPGTLADPFLQLFSGSTPIDSNDDFGTRPNAGEIPAANRPASPKESAILTTLSPGAYTVIVSGVGQTSGIAIVEVFEIDAPESQAVNIATRARVETGDNVMIAGFILQGDGPKKVLITARGPSLAAQGVTGTLADPSLQLFSGATVIDSNDDFGSRANANEIPATQKPSNAKEAAILTTLNPGAYTVIVSGVGATSGIAIVEVFAQ